MREVTIAEQKIVTGAGANSATERVGHMKNFGGIPYGGQANGFVGTQSNGMDLTTLVTENACAAGIIGGLVAGGPSVPGAIRGVIGGSIAGQCYSGGNGGGGGTGSSNSGGCSGDNCSW